jgi:predicted outer membrane repeat protein
MIFINKKISSSVNKNVRFFEKKLTIMIPILFMNSYERNIGNTMLKKMILIIGLCILAGNNMFPQSITIWAKSDSPVRVNNSIIVSEKDTLSIEAGTVIEFFEQGQLVVNGAFQLQGTAQDTIHIISYSEAANIIFRNNEASSVRIDYTVFDSKTNQSGESFLLFENADNVEIENCHFLNGKAMLGGAVILKNSQISIRSSFFENNMAGQKGGAIYAENSKIGIESSRFKKNSAEYFGGAISLDRNSYLRIVSTLFLENRAGYGGIISCEQSEAEIANITAVHNAATYGGLFYLNQADFTVTNSILWNQLASTGYIAFAHDNSQLKCDYCCYTLHDKNFIKNKRDKMILFDINSIHANPVFYLGYNGTYSLQETSPCIDAGTTDIKGSLITEKDISKNPRIENGRIDMGAFEWNQIKKKEKILLDYTLFHLPEDGEFYTIQYSIPEKQDIVLQILTSDNHLINEFFISELPAGEHEFVWDRADFQENQQSKGYYFFRILAKDK